MPKKPLGKAIPLPESESAEAATPDERDILRADELASSDPILEALWNAETFERDGED